MESLGLYSGKGDSMRAARMAIWCIAFVLLAAASAKEPAAQVIVWPASGPPVLRFSFAKFKETSASGKQHNYTSDVTAENLWSKKISEAQFTFYVYDKTKVRIGDGYISINDVSPGHRLNSKPSLAPPELSLHWNLSPKCSRLNYIHFSRSRRFPSPLTQYPRARTLKSTALRRERRPRLFKSRRGSTF